METGLKIFEAIPAIIADIEAIQKTRKENTQIKYAYRGIDEFMNALNPLLAKHCVTIMPDVLKNDRDIYSNASGTRMTNVVMHIRYTLTAKDGSSTSGTMSGEAFDSGDKASNKAMSIALKYFIMQVFMVPTEDIDDPDDHDTAGKIPAKPKDEPKKVASDKAVNNPAQQAKDKAWINKKPTPAMITRLFAIAGSRGWSNEQVKATMMKCWNVESTKDLTIDNYEALVHAMLQLSPPEIV